MTAQRVFNASCVGIFAENNPIAQLCDPPLIKTERGGDKGRAENFRQLLHFLDDPRRLAVTAVPEKSVPLGQIFRATNAAELMDLLRIRIRANDQAYAKPGQSVIQPSAPNRQTG